jgi:hypothetical protein
MPYKSHDDEMPPAVTSGGRGRRRDRRPAAASKSHDDDDDDEEPADAPSPAEASSSNHRQATSRASAVVPSSSATSVIDDPDQDTVRIMISTDNHLGYAEDDNVRGNDSFAALEEVLYLAKHYRCDMVLLAGDLFHENRPTRRTLYKTSK